MHESRTGKYAVIVIIFLLFASSGVPMAAAAKQKIPSPCQMKYPSDDGIAYECQRLKGRETLESRFGEHWQKVLRFNRIDRRHLHAGIALKVPKNLADLDKFEPMPADYPKAAAEAKFILVDLTEQFLGAYEHGRLVMSFPIASGGKKNQTPDGDFRITALSRNHRSSEYKIEKTRIPYPMHYGLRFFINRRGVAFWIHGRDMPGYPASHGCIGLYDEEMQKTYYRYPPKPLLEDAKTLYEWVNAPLPDEEKFRVLKDGPRVLIRGEEPF